MENSKNKKIRPALGRGLSALISSAPVPVSPPAETVKLVHESPLPSISVGPSQAMQSKKLVSIITSHSTATSNDSNATNESVRYLALSSIVNNPDQPRQNFSEQELSELTNSIKNLGVLQPILVRPSAKLSGKYEIVAGERRWRAAERAKLAQVPVIIKELEDRAAYEIALVENVQRADLGALEVAKAYNKLIEEFNLTQEDVAERVGKDRASVANYVRLLKLPEAVQKLVAEGKLSMGHARAILTVREPSAQMSLAQKVLSENLSVRALEQIVARVVVLDRGKRRIKGLTTASASDFPEITDRLRKVLGTKIAIRHSKSGRGKIEIEYFSEQELERLVEILES